MNNMKYHSPPLHKHTQPTPSLLYMLLLLLELNNHQNQNRVQTKQQRENYKMVQNNYPDDQDILIKRQPTVSGSQIFKTVTPLVVSISILFSLLLSHSSVSLYFHSFRNSKLFSYTMDKNSMFLLCNGLLVFLVKFSRYYDHGGNKIDHIEPPVEIEEDHHAPTPKLEEEPTTLETETSEKSVTDNNVAHQVDYEEKEEGEEIKSGSLITGNEGNRVEVETSFVDEEDDEEEELVFDEKISVLEGVEEEDASTEELNKKFDEFIRKMKEGIRFEADQQRLVLVN